VRSLVDLLATKQWRNVAKLRRRATLVAGRYAMQWCATPPNWLDNLSPLERTFRPTRKPYIQVEILAKRFAPMGEIVQPMGGLAHHLCDVGFVIIGQKITRCASHIPFGREFGFATGVCHSSPSVGTSPHWGEQFDDDDYSTASTASMGCASKTPVRCAVPFTKTFVREACIWSSRRQLTPRF